MKHFYQAFQLRYYSSLVLLAALMAVNNNTADAQSCPLNSNQSISTYPNTFYPAAQSYVNAGSTSIILGSVTYGVTPSAPATPCW